MNVLVTGANGFLGTALVERLLLRGEDRVRCLVRQGSDTGALERILEKHPGLGAELFIGSLASDRAAAPALEGVDLVYHLAAGAKGAAADLFLNSAVATKNLMEAISASGRLIRVVFVSSFGVYGVAGLKPGTLIDESTPLEEQPTRRDLYSYSKLRQEQLVWQYHRERGIPVTVLRPGVIYGPRGSRISGRVGLAIGPLFLVLGNANTLPLTYVDNCADALIAAANHPDANGEVYNVVDDDLPTCREYLRLYRREVERPRCLPIPYPVMLALSRSLERYHIRSKGQLPAAFTPYKTASSWKGFRFSNLKLKRIGWHPEVSTAEGLRRTFESFRAAAAAAPASLSAR